MPITPEEALANHQKRAQIVLEPIYKEVDKILSSKYAGTPLTIDRPAGLSSEVFGEFVSAYAAAGWRVQNDNASRNESMLVFSKIQYTGNPYDR